MNYRVSHIIRSIAALVLTLSGFAIAQTPVSLYNSFSGPVNYTVVGGSLRDSGNTLSTRSAMSYRATDTSKLIYPSGATIIGAYLYWAGSGSSADNSVTLNGNTVSASRTFSESYLNGALWLYFFGGFADVTSYVASAGNNLTYTFGGLTVDTSYNYQQSQAAVAGWALVVVYYKETEVKKSVNVFDGFEIFRGEQITFTPNNFYVPYSLVEGKMTHITFEGDKENSTSLSGFTEQVLFNATALTDAYNPAANQFGSRSNAFPEDSTFGVDIDTYDITSLLSPADTQAVSVYSSGGDLVILNVEVISIADTSNSDIRVTKSHSGGSIVAGNTVTYTLAVSNYGPDTTGVITLVDSIRSGLTFVSSTFGPGGDYGTGWTIDSTQRPKYVWTHTGAHPDSTDLPPVTVTAYLTAVNYPTQLNSAYASSPQFDRKPWNNSSTDSLTILTPIFLTSTKSYSDLNGGSVRPGDTLLFTIGVTNSGNYSATNITVIDSMPTGMSVVPGSFSPSATYTGTSASGQVVTFNNYSGPLTVSSSTNFIFRALVDSGIAGATTVTNVARVRAATIDQRVTASFVPVNSPPVTISKFQYPPGSGTGNGDTVQYYLIVKNNSTLANSTNTIVVDTIPEPSGTTANNPYYLIGSASAGVTVSVGNPAGDDDTLLTWNLGTLAPGDIDTVRFKTRISNGLGNGTFVTNRGYVTNDQGRRDSSIHIYRKSNTYSGLVTGTRYILPGDPIFYQLYDADLNTSSTTIQALMLRDTNRVNNERDTIRMTETAANSGAFAGMIATRYSATAGSNDNDTFYVKPGDSLRITYIDASDSAGNANVWRSFVTRVLNGHVGQLSGTDSVKPGETIYYTLNDSDLNRSNTIIESYTLRDSNQMTGEIENRVFTETGVNTGIFTASVPTVFGTVSNGNNNGTFAVQKGDTITMKYYDTVVVNGSYGGLKTWKTYIRGGQTAVLSATSPVRPRDSVTVTITDFDLNTRPSIIDTISVQDSSVANGEVENFFAIETGANTGIFTGKIATQYGATAGTNNNGTFNVKAGDSLRVSYYDSLLTNGSPGGIKTVRTFVIGGVNASLTATSPINPLDSLLITLTDADLNYSASIAETYTLRDSNIATTEIETFTVTETGVNTGIFTKWVRTVFGLGAGTNNDGIFSVKAGDSLRVTYRDSLRLIGSDSTMYAFTRVLGGTTGALTADSTIYPADSVLVTVTDADLNLSASLIESYTVRDSNISTGEFETFTITETGVNTGIFTKWLRTVFGLSAGTNNDGIFNVSADDSLRVTYIDSLRLNGSDSTLRAITRVRGGVTATVSSTTPITPWDSLLVSVTDADLNRSASIAETYTVRDTNIVTGEIETFTVTETGVNTGIFTKWIRTVFGVTAGTNNDGIYNVKAGDTLRVTYRDSLMANGGAQWISAITVVLGGVTATIGSNPAIIAANDTSLFTLTDSDLNTNAASVQSYVLSLYSKTGETETKTFTETGVNTGIFTALVPTISGTTPGTNGNGIFTVQPNDTITVIYHDSLRILGDTATINAIFRIGTVTFSASSKSYVDGNGGFVKPPDTLQYSVKVKNTGTVAATNVALVDSLPNHVTILVGTISNSGSRTGQVITWPAFTLAAGDSATYQYSVRIDSSIVSQVPYVNRATIDGNGIRTQVTATFTPVNRPLMTMTKTVSNGRSRPGDTLTYTIAYSNIGTVPAALVTVTDVQPDNTTYVPNSTTINSVSKTDASDADEVTLTGITVQLNIGLIAPGASGTVTLKVRIN